MKTGNKGDSSSNLPKSGHTAGKYDNREDLGRNQDNTAQNPSADNNKGNITKQAGYEFQKGARLSDTDSKASPNSEKMSGDTINTRDVRDEKNSDNQQ